MEWIREFDTSLLAWFRDRWGTRFDEIMLDITALGGTAVLVLVTLFSTGLLLVLRRYRTALFVLAVIIGGELLVAGLKELVQRERPESYHPLLPARSRSWSFPSGHSMSSTMTYLTLAFVAATPLTGRRGRVYVVGSALLLVFLIGTSRAYLNVHWPTDVLGGWTFGLVWALACRGIEDRWKALRQEEAAEGAS